MTDVIELKTGNPRPPGPPDLRRSFFGMSYHIAKADTVDDRDELDRAAFNLVCDLFEQIGGIEAAWKETYKALWPE